MAVTSTNQQTRAASYGQILSRIHKLSAETVATQPTSGDTYIPSSPAQPGAKPSASVLTKFSNATDKWLKFKDHVKELEQEAKAKAKKLEQEAKAHLGTPWKPGPGSLHGADTSHYQSLSEFADSVKGAKWSAIKASQGTGYVDPVFKSRWDLLGQKVASGAMKLRMAYGFLDPGDGVAQAKHFLDVVGVNGPLPAGTRLVLDWEGAALNSPQTLRDAANYIHKVTGTWPLIYVQGSMMQVAKNAVPHAPIWEAAYGSGINKNVPFFQYSDGPNFDHDVFNGTIQALKRFAGWA